MTDYISKSALFKELAEKVVEVDKLCKDAKQPARDYYAGEKRGITNSILFAYALPTIDAVPVVRCAECISFDTEGDGFGICQLHEMTRREEHFCSDGKRSEDD